MGYYPHGITKERATRSGLYLSNNNYLSTPSSSSLDITTDLEVEWHGALNDWTPSGAKALVGRYVTSGNQLSWCLVVASSPAGRLQFYHSADGSTSSAPASTVAPTVADGGTLGIKVTFDVDNGVGGRTTTFYTSTDEGATWTQLGDAVTTAGTTSIFNSSAIMEIGSIYTGTVYQLDGRVDRVVVRNGIGGPIIASPTFTAPKAPRFRDEQNNLWTINGSNYAWQVRS